jgi:hypothetical protein
MDNISSRGRANLNSDIFEQMIQQTDLSKCFEDYSGGNDVNEAMKFIKEQFQAKVKDNRVLHVYFIAARFKKDVKYTWEEVKSILCIVSFYTCYAVLQSCPL